MATTKVNYKVKVINISTHLNIRGGHSMNDSVTGKRNNGDTFVVDQVFTEANGQMWYREKGTNKWSCAKTSSGKKYIKVTQDMGDNSGGNNDDKKKKKIKTTGTVTVQVGKSDTVNNESSEHLGLPKHRHTRKVPNDKDVEIPKTTNIEYSNYQKYYILGSESTENYPYPDTSGIKYINRIGNGKYNQMVQEYTTRDYSLWNITEGDYSKRLNQIKRSINAPNAWTPKQLKRLTYVNFNRFKMDFPDINLKGSKAVVFVTRPQLNIVNDAATSIMQFVTGKFDWGDGVGVKAIHNSNITADVRLYNLVRQDPTMALLLSAPRKSLTNDRVKSLATHNLNPLLSNLAYSLDVQDDSVDGLEMGETVTGYKMQYSKHSNKSVAAGDVTIKYKETDDLAVTRLHQVWVDYQSDVYKGVLAPTRAHIWKKELDYLCNIYYFLLAEDGETVIFWSKYYGCYPQNVPKSTLSYDRGSEVSFPEVSVTYHYIYKEDWSPQALVEFNEDAGVGSYGESDEAKLKYVPTYMSGKLHTGSTWVGTPFLQTVPDTNTFNWSVYNSSELHKVTSTGDLSSAPYSLKLRYRSKSANDSPLLDDFD